VEQFREVLESLGEGAKRGIGIQIGIGSDKAVRSNEADATRSGVLGVGLAGVRRDIQVGGMKRDRELVRWIARLGAVEIGHVKERFGTCRSVSYAVVARLVDAGLIERIATLPGDPTLLSATRQGIRYAGLGLPAARVGPGAVDHWLACADVAIWAERGWGRESVMSERELRFAELDASKPIASAIVDELPDGRPMLHRPDLVVREDGNVIAIEVELTPKAPRRLERIVRSWRRTRYVSQILYLCPPGPTQRAVERAVAATHAQERVEVVDLGEMR
jgi:hypothetical protein